MKKLSLAIFSMLIIVTSGICQTDLANFEIELKKNFLDSLDRRNLEVKDTILITFHDTTNYKNIKVKWVNDEFQYLTTHKNKYLTLRTTITFTSDSTLLVNQNLDHSKRFIVSIFKRKYGVKSIPLPYKENLYFTASLVYDCKNKKWVTDPTGENSSYIIKI